MDYTKYIEEYKKNIERYDELGESVLPFKSFGAKSGVYQERCGTTYMVRPRTTAGIIDLDILRTIKYIADKYSNGTVRISSRQDFQIHKVKLLDTAKVMDVLKSVGLYSIGTGGNTSRNVTSSPMTGFGEYEEFDVTEYAKLAADYLSENENNLCLPRKFKTSFSSESEDRGSASFADLGFLAVSEENEKKFNVYGGGGLGPAPRVSMLLAEKIDSCDMLYYLDAMIEFFRQEGDRENRGKARLRHLVKKYGEEEFKKRYNGYLEEARKKDLSFVLSSKPDIGLEKPEKTKVKSVFLEKTKLEGIYGVYVHPRGGTLNSELLSEIIDFLENLEYEPDIRLTPTQGMMIRNLAGNDAKKAVELLRKHMDDAEVSKSICCVGADTCRVGINASQNLLENIVKSLRRLDINVKRELPKLYISGCPSSCGQHQIGAISFSGKRKNIDGVSKEAYSVYFGGRLGFKSQAAFAERYGDLLSEDIPEFLIEIAKMKYDSKIQDIYNFLETKDAQIRALVDKYGV